MISFNDDTAATAPAAKQGIPKYSKQPLDKYLLNVDRLVKEECEKPEAKIRAQAIIQMCRRHRGATPSDLFGFWRGGVWADSPRYSQLHGTNVFQALIRAAESGFSQADVMLDIAAKANNFENRSVEKISRSIYEILNKTQWDEAAQQAIFYSMILKLNAFVISRLDKARGPKLPKPLYSQMGYQMGGTFVCPQCYASGEYTPDLAECPQCGFSPISLLDDPVEVQDYGVAGFGEIPAGEAEIAIADALDVTVDDRAGRPADVRAAGWVQWRYFVQKGELKKLYPHLACDRKPDWSYTTRLKVAFKRYENGEAMPQSQFEKQQYEMKQTWLSCDEYEDYVAPEDFQLGRFSIRAGERLYDVAPEGLVFGFVNDELAFVDAEDKDRRIKSCVWLADPTSFYGLGARAGLPIQKKINQLDNMAMEGEARSLKGAVVYVPEAVDGAHLEGANTNIPLRPDFATGGEPLKNFILPLDVSGLSQSSLMFLSSQVDTMQRVMGIPDVSLGEGDRYAQTAQGQQLVSQRATGLLVPAKKSEGQMKVGWLRDQLDLIQKFYSAEALRQFGARFGEEWLDDEIEAFLSADLDKAVTVTMVDGSEIPESRQEKQMRLRGDIATGFIPLTPQLRSKLAQQAGYDGIDVGDYESNHKLATKRFDAVRAAALQPQAEMMYQQFEMQLTDPATGQRALDEAGNLVPNPAVLQLLADPLFRINRQGEDHDVHFQFWSDKYRQAMGSGIAQPGLLAAACDAMMTRHRQSFFEQATQNNMLTGLSQMPAQMAGQLGMQSVMPPEPEKDGKSSEKK